MNFHHSLISRHGVTTIIVRAFALIAAILPSACNAQSPGGTSATAPPTAVAPLFCEPATTGKIVDKHTLQPIAGVFVYGYYITYGDGTRAGGSRIGKGVKGFLTQTDANGVWR
jgi:hypothetical protein